MWELDGGAAGGDASTGLIVDAARSLDGACLPVDECHEALIDPGPGPLAGQCLQYAVPDQSPCNDANACTQIDRCVAGKCVGGNPIVCPVPNPGCAAADLCDPSDGTCRPCYSWQAGWDDLRHPLDYARSYALPRLLPGTRDLQIHYHFEGGEPFTSHYVGLALFLPTVSCPDILGDVRFTTPCDPGPRRQGVTVPAVQGFDPGVVIFDAAGRGDADVVFHGIAPGTIRFELIVRLWGDGRASCPNCAVIHQSPGPFGSTATLTIN